MKQHNISECKDGNCWQKEPTYRIGVCSKSSIVYWVLSDQKEYAEGIFVTKTKIASVVLFDEQKGLPIVFSSIHPVDVACILVAYNTIRHQSDSRLFEEEFTEVDRSLVEQAVASGDAPLIPPSRSKTHQWLLKRSMDALFWRESVRFFSAGPHRYASLCCYRVSEYPAVRGHVALTLDDAPCRFSRGNSRLSQVLETLAAYNKSTATFMMVGKFMENPSHQCDLIELLQQGHEMGNHGMVDRAYDADSPQDFAQAVDQCSDRIKQVQRLAGVSEGVHYFRAPHGKYTRAMESVLHSRKLCNVMCDTYASCPIIEDGEYIGSSLSQRAQHGSIILLHMPERGFRDWCMVALIRLLDGLKERNLKVVSVSKLEALAHGGMAQA